MKAADLGLQVHTTCSSQSRRPGGIFRCRQDAGATLDLDAGATLDLDAGGTLELDAGGTLGSSLYFAYLSRPWNLTSITCHL